MACECNPGDDCRCEYSRLDRHPLLDVSCNLPPYQLDLFYDNTLTCDKTFESSGPRFPNTKNFEGFPHVPDGPQIRHEYIPPKPDLVPLPEPYRSLTDCWGRPRNIGKMCFVYCGPDRCDCGKGSF